MYDTEWSREYLEGKSTAKSAVKISADLKAHIITIIQKHINSLEEQEQIGYKMNNMMLVHRKTGGIDALQQILAEIELLDTEHDEQVAKLGGVPLVEQDFRKGEF